MVQKVAENKSCKQSCKADLQTGAAKSNLKQELWKGVEERSCRVELQEGVVTDGHYDHDHDKTGNARSLGEVFFWPPCCRGFVFFVLFDGDLFLPF